MRRYYDYFNEGKKDNFSIVRLMKKYNFDRTSFESSEFELISLRPYKENEKFYS